ncbi:unnamed protein product [Soboliphyme baturini]|uniref:Dimer_Tnp_hAT domain-containing protein n=1 Tax=Soboliphyme baturini TaxID=241478 RepID=A0A183INV8_9BILA|nr:unnamed protein product [Soboliphyme baturini]
MRRIVNALAVTGRLMRAFDIDFSWITLAHWISLIEQWPYQLSWMIEYVEKNKVHESATLADLYETVRNLIPTEKNDYLMEMDRNPKTLDAYFKSELDPILTVGQLKSFVPFTSNLDPYIRKLIREQFDSSESTDFQTVKQDPDEAQSSETHASFYGVKKLFSGPPWHNWLLSSMTVDEVCALMKLLPVSSTEALETYCRRCQSANVSGLVLSVCNLEKLKSELRMSFGDWELFSLMVAWQHNIFHFSKLACHFR